MAFHKGIEKLVRFLWMRQYHIGIVLLSNRQPGKAHDSYGLFSLILENLHFGFFMCYEVDDLESLLLLAGHQLYLIIYARQQ